MGNCIKPSTQQGYNEDADMEAQYQGEMLKENGDSKRGGVRIKMVLTKEELEWLMFRLKANGDNKIEDILRDIEGWREKGKAWKPSLESIAEDL